MLGIAHLREVTLTGWSENVAGQPTCRGQFWGVQPLVTGSARVRPRTSFVEAALPPQADDAGYYGMHPALLDAAVQSVGFAGLDDEHKLL
ncbi:polyketide synthase dehydratase domain-containing protein, partial [Streptomyces sp. MA25(2023)]|uniref:polyketide synthase dehydratase domain-containing protein n=1 Tax=Streptomyces sp. MA25(2023) TaxID=3055078 RepID=UPI00339D818A